jgi:SPP1 family predicted phage head-tail adaptor
MPLERLKSKTKNAIGAMDRTVTFYLPGDRNGDGSSVPGSPAFTTWAAIKTRVRGSKETDQPHQIGQISEHVISIPYQRGVLESMTIGYENRIFEIDYIVDEDEGHIFLDCICSEIGQNAGQGS